jgi:hypothetical protein
MPVVLGSLDYFGVPFPLVLGDRYFVVSKSAFGFNLDVFRWDSSRQQHIYEVLYGKAVEENINESPNATVVFRQLGPKLFVYKFKAKTAVREIDGSVPIDKEFVVRIDPQEINVKLNGVHLASFSPNQTEGPLGLIVRASGSYTMGGNILPAGMELKRGYYAKT